MSKIRTISIDIMGGDFDPYVSIEALKRYLLKKQKQDTSYLLFGNLNMLKSSDISMLESKGCKFIHTDQKISSQDLPTAIIRNKETSMYMAIAAVAEGRADAVMSSGNTGALVVLSKLLLKTFKSIKRPAICSLVPSESNCSAMVDMGANPNQDIAQMLSYADMGSLFITSVFGILEPKVGLLNIGEEEIKGSDFVKKTHELIEKTPLTFGKYIGYVEPADIFAGKCHVTITDGFTGNIYIKTAESTSSMIKKVITSVFRSNIFTKLAYKFLIERKLMAAFKKNSKSGFNGALLAGLKSICIKSHGSSSADGVMNAIKVTENAVDAALHKKMQSIFER